MNLPDFNTMVTRFATQARASTAAALDFTVGSIFRALAEANAAVALWLQWLILVVLRQTRLATSLGAEADTFVGDYGLTRLPGIAATGIATFSRLSTGLATAVPVGATCRTPDGIAFIVTTDTTNPAWNGSGYTLGSTAVSVSVPVAAVSAGVAGNIQGGALSVLTSAIAGVDTVTNLTPFANGFDAESDADLKVRFQLYIDNLSKGTAGAVEFAVLSVQQGLNLAIAENQDTTGAYRPGFFVVTVDDGTGSPSSTLLASVNAAVDAVRAVGVSFVVQKPVIVTAVVTMTITASPGYVKSSLIGPVAQAILAYVDTLPIGTPLAYSRLFERAFSVPGVMNINSVLLNGRTADLGGGATQVVRSTVSNVVVA